MRGSGLSSQIALEECSCIRILVIGMTGVGKSTLINCAFKANIANVSDRRASVSNIENELIPPENPRFILHDSQGLETGEVDNLNKIKDFVKRRMAEPKVQDRLHAIWLCVEVPRAGGRLFEAGTEESLRLGGDELPVIVVFTKCDLLLLLKRNELRGKLPEVERTLAAKRQADVFFEERCKTPLIRLVRNPSYVRVSYDDYSSLSRLLEVTSSLVPLPDK
ncbi:hypothetical protein JAAARDRAFT_197135 [Jaapia argillacea MUCL 33604]|uniref:G domain-containing protein n=1 Tax=Jaapia argillacea MUCL 33604 TaxID=933084 RepID=A0A067PFI7_9AGAM|nr:hypothetical protein JAAARDRAFT_197135 [Jaapia argillacea MUCL 33604]